jgi:hypothetical protein
MRLADDRGASIHGLVGNFQYRTIAGKLMGPISIELFAYPWDILDEGEETFLDRCLVLGVNRVHAAVSYHSGKFLLPQHSQNRVYFPEPGALYFQPGAGWTGALEQPVSKLASSGWLERLAGHARSRGVELCAWTVFFHNSVLGARYPELAARNAFGDPYHFALCPSRPEVRDHSAAMCRSLASLGIFESIDLETIGYLGYYHGYHHEVTAVPLGMADTFLLSLCFCTACRGAGETAGIDMEAMAAELRRVLARRMRSDDAIPSERGGAENIATLLALYPPLHDLVRLRMQTVTDLVARLARDAAPLKLAACTSSFVGSPSNIWMEGVSPASIKNMVDCFSLLAYAPDAADANADLVFFLSLLDDASKINLTINLGMPLTRTCADAAAKVEFARRQGVRRFSFFNYGLLGPSRLRWIHDLACIARGSGE